MPKREIKLTILGDASQLGRTFGKAAAESKGFGTTVKGHVAGAMGGIKGALGIGAAAAGVGLVGGFVKAIKSAGDFQQTLSVFQSTAGATAGRMKLVSAAAIALGNDARLPGTSAKDAADAMLELAKGGLTAKQAMDAARGTLVLSAAAQVSNAEAATMVADSLNAFELKAGEASRVADILAASANATTASMPEMGDALKQVGAVAHNLGIPIEDVSSAIGELANRGIKGSDAGTSLKTMLMSLNPKSKQAREAMMDLGVSAFDANGKFVGLRSVIKQYHDALGPLSDEQRAQALQTIFGSDATRAAAIIFGQGAKGFDKMKGAVTQAGAAQKNAEAQTAGFNGALGGLTSTLETVALQLGMKLLPAATSALNFMSANIPVVVGALGSMAGFVSRNGEAFKTLAIIVGVATGALVAYKVATVAMAAAQAVWTMLTNALFVVRNAQLALNVAMSLNPIGVVITLVAALVVGLIVAYRHSETFRNIVNTAFAVVKGAAQSCLNWITGTGIPAFRSALNAVMPVVRAVATLVSVQFNLIKGYITTVASVANDIVHGRWSSAWNTAKTAVSNLASAVRTALGKIPGYLSSAAATAGSMAPGIGIAIARGIANGLGSLAGWLRSKVTDLAGSLVSAATSRLHINSPSKVFRDIVGRAIPEGIADGIDRHAGLAHASVSGLAGGLLDSAMLDSPAFARVGTAGAGGGTVINVTVQGSVQSERDLARTILDHAKDMARRGGSVLPAAAVGGTR